MTTLKRGRGWVLAVIAMAMLMGCRAWAGETPVNYGGSTGLGGTGTYPVLDSKGRVVSPTNFYSANLATYVITTNGSVIGPKGIVSAGGTVSAGINEAIADMTLAPNSDPTNRNSIPGGGTILLQGPGVFKITQKIVAPSYTNRPFWLNIRGEGNPMVWYVGPGGSNVLETTQSTPSFLFNGLHFECSGITFLTQPNSTNAIIKLGNWVDAYIHDCNFVWNQDITNDPGGYTFNFELLTPVQPGWVGIWLDDCSSVYSTITRNTFHGLACAVRHGGNRGVISENRFSVGYFRTNSAYTYNTLWTNAFWKDTKSSFLGLGPAIFYEPFDLHELTIRNNVFWDCGAELIVDGTQGGISVLENYSEGAQYEVVTYNEDSLSVFVSEGGQGSQPSLNGNASLTLNDSALPWFTFGAPDASITSVSNGIGGNRVIRAATNVFIGTFAQTNGPASLFSVASYVSNKVDTTSISVTSSVFHWTNTIGKNLFVFVDAHASTTASLGLNSGTSAMSGTNTFTVPLQPGESLDLTYTGTAPTARYKPW